MIIDPLKKYPTTLKLFTVYLIETFGERAKFILNSDDLKVVIGYYLSFLENQKLFLLVGDDKYVIYFRDVETKYITDCGVDRNALMLNYSLAIESAFETIEKKLTKTPF